SPPRTHHLRISSEPMNHGHRSTASAFFNSLLGAAGVPASAYRTVSEALADPQLAHRQALSEVRDEGGSFQVLNLPFRMSGADITPAKTMAVLGEHTDALREEISLADDASIPTGKTAATG
ncbi:CoA transferase, partial [Bradyrhizobium sp. SBR1B]|uniref:CoA transferase n=1 Tax=Bradyrhizobium sp. SBR1B TaxID=2663836 RepID=UPI001FEDB995